MDSALLTRSCFATLRTDGFNQRCVFRALMLLKDITGRLTKPYSEHWVRLPPEPTLRKKAAGSLCPGLFEPFRFSRWPGSALRMCREVSWEGSGSEFDDCCCTVMEATQLYINFHAFWSVVSSSKRCSKSKANSNNLGYLEKKK